MNTLNKEQIVEAAFAMIEESLEWGTVDEYKSEYAHFVDGIVAATRKMLNKLDEVNDNACCEQ